MAALFAIDYLIFDFINQTCANTVFDFIFPIIRNATTWIPLYILIFIYLYHRYKQLAIVYILYLLIAFAFADIISVNILKPFFARLRPCHSTIIPIRLVLDSCGGKWSFPSTHASNHMAIASSIIFAGIFKSRIINFLWITWAVIIGIAQVYVGVHYPSDIIGGFIFGFVVAIINYMLFFPFLRKLFANYLKR